MIHSDQIHMCRIVLLDMIEEAQEGEKYSVHINAIRNRIDRFIAPKQTRDILEILTFSDEVTHLGMGWYQPLSPIFVAIGCGGLAFIGRRRRTFLIIKNVYYCF